MDEQELDFLAGLLCMDPARRLTGQRCLEHPYLAGLSGTTVVPTAAAALARARSDRTLSPHMRASYTGEGTPKSSLSASSSQAGGSSSEAGGSSRNDRPEDDVEPSQ